MSPLVSEAKAAFRDRQSAQRSDWRDILDPGYVIDFIHSGRFYTMINQERRLLDSTDRFPNSFVKENAYRQAVTKALLKCPDLTAFIANEVIHEAGMPITRRVGRGMTFERLGWCCFHQPLLSSAISSTLSKPLPIPAAAHPPQ